MTQEKKYDVFISYSRKDFDEVNAFVEMLKQRIPTLDIWFDLDGIESGDEFRDKIISAIKRSKYVLFALSKNSDQSEWTRKELQFAKGKKIKIIPLLLKGVQLQEMDWFLFEFGGLDCIDITDNKQSEKVVNNLAKWTNKALIQDKKEPDKQETSTFVVKPTPKPTPTPISISVPASTLDPPKQPSQPKLTKYKSQLWIKLWTIVALLIIAVSGVIGINQVHQLEEIKREQILQDSIRQVHIQDSIRRDSIRLEQKRIRQDSITAAERVRKEKEDKERLLKPRKLDEEQRIAQELKRIEHAHEYVDLGLSVKWATCNVGANKPEERGKYFAWGETEPKEIYNWSTYKWCNGSYDSLTKYNNSSSYGTVDNKTQLDLTDDAAAVNWGGSWRMPTKAEQKELREKCTWTWTSQNGVNGYKVTSKSNGNSIFLPAAGLRSGSSLKYAGSYGYYW